MTLNEQIAQDIVASIALIDMTDLDSLVDTINTVRAALHNISPFRTEPVDFVKWVRNTTVYANDYNPNSVAPPEMELLRVSIEADGYTQLIVAMPDTTTGAKGSAWRSRRVKPTASILK